MSSSGKPRSLKGKPRVLAVEDNRETQILLKHFFKETYDVTVATSEEEALEAAREKAFDVFLLDINLGKGGSGTDLLARLREEEEVDDAPAIALTAYASPDDEERFLGEGFDGYVSKPFTREEVTEAIEEIRPNF